MSTEREKPASMRHWNGNMTCVIDTETTGLDPMIHEIWQICILPLNANLEINKNIMPFYILMKPEHPEYIDWDVPVMKHNKSKICKAITEGYDKCTAIGLLEKWIEKLNLPVTKYGTPKRIIPLGQNYGFDKSFIQQWLSLPVYDQWFDYHYKDTMQVALYLNDKAACHAEKVPFNKVNLRWIANKLGVGLPDAHYHDALADCKATAESYRKLCYLRMI